MAKRKTGGARRTTRKKAKTSAGSRGVRPNARARAGAPAKPREPSHKARKPPRRRRRDKKKAPKRAARKPRRAARKSPAKLAVALRTLHPPGSRGDRRTPRRGSSCRRRPRRSTWTATAPPREPAAPRWRRRRANHASMTPAITAGDVGRQRRGCVLQRRRIARRRQPDARPGRRGRNRQGARGGVPGQRRTARQRQGRGARQAPMGARSGVLGGLQGTEVVGGSEVEVELELRNSAHWPRIRDSGCLTFVTIASPPRRPRPPSSPSCRSRPRRQRRRAARRRAS